MEIVTMNCLCQPKVVVGKEFGFMEETKRET